MITKLGVKMNLRIKIQNHAVDSKIRSPQKIDFRADGTHESNPTAWELRNLNMIPELNYSIIREKQDFLGKNLYNV